MRLATLALTYFMLVPSLPAAAQSGSLIAQNATDTIFSSLEERILPSARWKREFCARRWAVPPQRSDKVENSRKARRGISRDPGDAAGVVDGAADFPPTLPSETRSLRVSRGRWMGTVSCLRVEPSAGCLQGSTNCCRGRHPAPSASSSATTWSWWKRPPTACSMCSATC